MGVSVIDCLSDLQLLDLISNPERDAESNSHDWLNHIGTCESCSSRLETLSIAGFPDIDLGRSTENTLSGQLDATVGLATPGNKQVRRNKHPRIGRVGRYELIEEAGRGGMGRVYRARDTRLDRIVAIKVLSPELARAAAFLIDHEALAGARIEHPNVVMVYSIESLDDWPVDSPEKDGTAHVLVTQFVDGCTLSSRIATGDLNVEESVRLIIGAAEGLQAAHDQQIIHRDVKPQNILVESESGHAKISDFGLAIDIKKPGRKISGGTPGFLSPEILNGCPPDARSDIFALGMTLFQSVTQTTAFPSLPADESGLLPLFTRPEESVHAPEDLQAIICKATRADPAQRYPTMLEFSNDLRCWQAGESVSARRSTLKQTLVRSSRKHRWKYVSAAAFLSLSLLSVILWNIKSFQFNRLSVQNQETELQLIESEKSLSRASARQQKLRKQAILEKMKEQPLNPDQLQTRLADAIGSFGSSAGNPLESDDKIKCLETHVRSANAHSAAGQKLMSLAEFEKAAALATEINVNDAEPMVLMMLLRQYRYSAELNLNTGRVDAAAGILDQFDVFASRLSFKERGWNQRLELHQIFVRILRTRISCHHGDTISAGEELLSLRTDCDRLAAIDFSKHFITNKHRIELAYKWCAGCLLAGNASAAESYLTAALSLEQDPDSENSDEIRTAFTTWKMATDEFVRLEHFEFAQRTNCQVESILTQYRGAIFPEKFCEFELEKSRSLDTLLSDSQSD